MVRNGANINYQIPEQLHTALMFGSLFYWNIHSIINILNTFNKACHNGHIEVVNVLLANGADPNIKSKDGQTALEFGESIHKYYHT